MERSFDEFPYHVGDTFVWNVDRSTWRIRHFCLETKTVGVESPPGMLRGIVMMDHLLKRIASGDLIPMGEELTAMDRICENCKHAVYGAIGNYCRIDKRGIKSKDKCPNSQFEKVEEKADCSGCSSDCGGCGGFWDPGVKTVMVTVDGVEFEIDKRTMDEITATVNKSARLARTYRMAETQIAKHANEYIKTQVMTLGRKVDTADDIQFNGGGYYYNPGDSSDDLAAAYANLVGKTARNSGHDLAQSIETANRAFRHWVHALGRKVDTLAEYSRIDAQIEKHMRSAISRDVDTSDDIPFNGGNPGDSSDD